MRARFITPVDETRNVREEAEVKAVRRAEATFQQGRFVVFLNCKGKVPKKGVVVEEDENVIDHVPPFFFFPWVIDIQNPESVLLVVRNKDCHEFRFKMVRIVISVSNVTSLKNCLCTVIVLSTFMLRRSETQFAENTCELKHNLLKIRVN